MAVNLWHQPDDGATISDCPKEENGKSVSKKLCSVIASQDLDKSDFSCRALYLNAFGVASITVLCGYAGMVIFAYYQGNKCDPIESKVLILDRQYQRLLHILRQFPCLLWFFQLVSNKDQLFPLFVMQVFGDIPCVPGLFVAGVFSGALSTVSSGLNSLAASTMQDIVHGACHIQLDERRSVLITKLLAIVYGIIGFVLIFLIKYTPGVLQVGLPDNVKSLQSLMSLLYFRPPSRYEEH